MEKNHPHLNQILWTYCCLKYLGKKPQHMLDHRIFSPKCIFIKPAQYPSAFFVSNNRAGTCPVQQSRAAVWCYHWWAAEQDLEEQEVLYVNTCCSAVRKHSYNKGGLVNWLWRWWWISALIRAVVKERAGTVSSQKFSHSSPVTSSHSPDPQSSATTSQPTSSFNRFSGSCRVTGSTAAAFPQTQHSEHHVPLATIQSPGIWFHWPETPDLLILHWITAQMNPSSSTLSGSSSLVLLLPIQHATRNLHLYQPQGEKASDPVGTVQFTLVPLWASARIWRQHYTRDEFWCTSSFLQFLSFSLFFLVAILLRQQQLPQVEQAAE